MLGAVFMATDYVTSPMSKKGMLIYGVCIGLLTVVIRLFGAYPEGMSFAILIMNAFTPLINTYLPKMRVQLLAHQQLVVEDGPVFFQVRFPNPAVLAQRLLRLFGQLQVGDQVIAVPRVSQVVFHVWHSFPRSWRAHSSEW